MLDKWIDSAIQAYYFKKENRHYIVENDDVKIVDHDNTGVIQKNMRWKEGLH